MILKILVILAYLFMLVLNTVANTLPLGGRTTGAVSAKYPSLFTPAGFTFSIWGIIYVALGLFVVFFIFERYPLNESLFKLMAFVFILSSLCNALWLWMWHHDQIILSTVVMVLLFLVLMAGFLIIKPEHLWLRLPFSLYFAWICVALVANITIMFVALDLDMLGLSESAWLIIVLILVGIIGLITVFRSSDIIFGLVFIWAYVGILFRHLTSSGDGLNLAYPQAVIVLGLFLTAFIIMNIYVYIMNGMHVFN